MSQWRKSHLLVAVIPAVFALAGCSIATSNETIGKPGNEQAVSAPCNTGSGLNIAIANNTTTAPSNVHWFVQQTRATASNPELVAGPFTLDKTTSVTCEALNVGQVVVTVGSEGSVTPPSAPTTDPTKQPTYVAPSPDTEKRRFQIIELSVPGIANLTAVDMFGIPIDMATDSGQSRVWKCYTDAVQSSLKKALTASGGNYSHTVRTGTNGEFVRLVSPNIVSGLHPSGYPDFDAYLSSMAGKTLNVKRTKGVDFSPYGYSYSGTVAADGSIVLKPTDTKSSDLSVSIPAGSLAGNDGVPANTGIYGNNSPYYLGTSKTAHYVSENDLYAAVYRDLVAGFAYGFWKKDGTNDSSTFDTSKAPGPFQGAQPKNPDSYNSWAAALWPVTGAYGFAFEDTFNPASTNPGVPVAASGTLTLTIQPDVTPAGNGC